MPKEPPGVKTLLISFKAFWVANLTHHNISCALSISSTKESSPVKRLRSDHRIRPLILDRNGLGIPIHGLDSALVRLSSLLNQLLSHLPMRFHS